MMLIRKFEDKDIEKMISIGNEVVEDGIAFPQEDRYNYLKKEYNMTVKIK